LRLRIEEPLLAVSLRCAEIAKRMSTQPTAGRATGITWILQHDGIDLQRIAYEPGKQPVFIVDNPSRIGSFRVCLDLGTQRPPKPCVRITAEFRDPQEIAAEMLREDARESP
jgi:hypothetical protein